ncbi:uncharacterized protein [Coffea arabica]|uniref:Uncharacterized protein isoform X2 n=1 Tax=Coffea arabica TaxID=13443 RepID=A0ABM4UW45_COFAR
MLLPPFFLQPFLQKEAVVLSFTVLLLLHLTKGSTTAQFHDPSTFTSVSFPAKGTQILLTKNSTLLPSFPLQPFLLKGFNCTVKELMHKNFLFSVHRFLFNSCFNFRSLSSVFQCVLQFFSKTFIVFHKLVIVF